MAEKTQYEKVKEITEELESGIQELFASDKYKQWLTTMSRFHDYSLNNTLLIAMQMPEASLVAGYNAWMKQFKRHVKQGEKAIHIIAPTPYKAKVQSEVIDPKTNQVVRDQNGDPLKEEVEVKRIGFKVTSVFDVSQTEGKELPTIGVDELTGSVSGFNNMLEALKKTCPVPIRFEDISSGAKGYFQRVENYIAIQKDMPEQQTLKTLIHEMAHQKLHSGENIQSRSSKEVEAESVAFTVCKHFGVDTSDYSFAYVAGWSEGKEMKELKASLDTIRTASNELITAIQENLEQVREAAVEKMEQKAEDLAIRLDQFGYDFAWYEYNDAIDDPVAFIEQTKADLMDGRNIDEILDYLNDVVEEDSPEVQDAKALIADITEYRDTYLDHRDNEEKKPSEKRSILGNLKEKAAVVTASKMAEGKTLAMKEEAIEC